MRTETIIARRSRLLQSSKEFVANFVPPDYFLDGILQRRFIYSLTGQTGSGKTAITLLLSAVTALPRGSFGGQELQGGRVVYFAGENPDDIRMRWIAMAEDLGFDPDEIDVHFLQGAGGLSENIDRIKREVEQLGGATLIIVDTAAAYFEGDEENAGVQQGNYARLLRELTTLRDGPCVIVNCHPTKNAGDDNLVPRGGGTFINEMDGNLTCAKSADSIAKLHWQCKFRGPEFDPLYFEMLTVTAPKLIDSRGRLIKTVIAKELSESQQREREAVSHRREDKILATMLENEGASIGDIAKAHGLSKSVVHRALKRLEQDKLVKNRRGRYELTRDGEGEAKKARGVGDGTAERTKGYISAAGKHRSRGGTIGGTPNATKSMNPGRSRGND